MRERLKNIISNTRIWYTYSTRNKGRKERERKKQNSCTVLEFQHSVQVMLSVTEIIRTFIDEMIIYHDLPSHLYDFEFELLSDYLIFPRLSDYSDRHLKITSSQDFLTISDK